MRVRSFREMKKDDAHDLVVYGCYAAAMAFAFACAYFIFVP